MTSSLPVATASRVKIAVAKIDLNPSGLTAKQIEEKYSNPQTTSLAKTRLPDFIVRRENELGTPQISGVEEQAGTYFKAESISHYYADEDSIIEVCDGSVPVLTTLLRSFSNILSSTTAYASYVIRMTQFNMIEIKIVVSWLKGHYTDHGWPKQIESFLQVKIAMIAHILEIPALQFQIMASLHKTFIDAARTPNSDLMNQIWLLSGHNSDPLLQLLLASMYVAFAWLAPGTKDLRKGILQDCERGSKHRAWAHDFDAYLAPCTPKFGNQYMTDVMTIDVNGVPDDDFKRNGWKEKFLDPIQRRRLQGYIEDKDFFRFFHYILENRGGDVAAHKHLADMGYLTLPSDKELKLPTRHIINQPVASKPSQQNKKRALPEQSSLQGKKRIMSSGQSTSTTRNVPHKKTPGLEQEMTSSSHSTLSMAKKPEEEASTIADEEDMIDKELKPSNERKLCVMEGTDLVILCRDKAFLFNRAGVLPNAVGVPEILQDRPYLKTLHCHQVHSTGLRVLHDIDNAPDFHLHCKKITSMNKCYAIGAAYGIGNDRLCDMLIDELLETFKEQPITIEVAEEICEQIELPYLEQKALEALHYGLWYDKSSQPGTITGMTRHQKAMSNVGESYRKVHEKLHKLKQKDHPGRAYARCSIGSYLDE